MTTLTRNCLRLTWYEDGSFPCQINSNGGEISSLVFLPHGKQLAIACKSDNAVRLWSMDHPQREIGPPMNLGGAVNAIAVSKDGKWIVGGSGGVDGNVVVWDTPNCRKESRSHERHKSKITALDVSPDSLRVASGSGDGTVMVWRINSEPVLHLEFSLLRNQDTSPVSCVKFSPAGGRIASGYSRCGDRTIQIWNSWTGDQLISIRTDGQITRSLAWSSDGRRLFAGGPRGSIRCFDIATGRHLASREDTQSDLITSICVSNTDQFLISASASARIIDIWDIKDISALRHLHSYRNSDVLSIAMSPNELHLVHAGNKKKIYRRHLTKSIPVKYFFHHLYFSIPSEPLTYISNAVYEIWTIGKLDETEEMLSNEIAEEGRRDFVQYTRANRSLVRARLRKWDEALEDAEAVMSHGSEKPLIAYLAKCIAVCGKGKLEGTANIFDVLYDSDSGGDIKGFIGHVKVALHDRGTEFVDFLQSLDLCLLAQKLASDAGFHINQGDPEKALQVLSSAPDLSPFFHASKAKTIFLIFGWNVYDLHLMIHQLKFQAFATSGRTQDAKDSLSLYESSSNEEVEMRKGVFGRLSEKFGDKAMCDTKYDDAITWYSMALELSRLADVFPDLSKRCFETFEAMNNTLISEKSDAIALYIDILSSHPQRMFGLLLKRSKARAERELWQEALNDANEAIRLDPESPWGHERRRAAIPGGHTQEKGVDKSGDVLLMVEEKLSRKLLQSENSCAVIDEAIHQIAKLCPLVLIDVQTGLLCDEGQRRDVFKEDPIYQSLASATTRPDIKHIVHVVARFFRYVMFSHRWGKLEPTFKDVSALPEKTVYKLAASCPCNKKLHKFCEMVKNDREGYRWAWSDTCCIDKEVESTRKKSIHSMYNWYNLSALTLVLLEDVSEGLPLKDSVWMTRAWTLQELLSPKTIRFYDREWKLYRDDTSTNHKESPRIMRELAEAIHVSPDNIVDFSPETLGVREKLRLASTRYATYEEDIAYALIGIFESDLTPEPRDAAIALGLLLQEIVSRYQEPAVLDWTGEPSTFNSCLPARIAVYEHSPYVVPSIADDDMKRQIAELRDSPIQQPDATEFFRRLSCLDPLHFTDRRLHLPCITFPVTITKCDTVTTSHQTRRPGNVYLAQAPALGKIEFRTTKELPSHRDKLVLAYPWIRDLLTQAHPPEGEVDEDTQASRLMVHIEQPFRALLLKKARAHNEYRRVATDSEIWVPGCKLTSLNGMHAEMLVVV